MVRTYGPRNDDPVEVNCTYLRHARDREVVVIEDADGNVCLLPCSFVTLDPEVPEQHTDITVTMPEWLAVKEGLV